MIDRVAEWIAQGDAPVTPTHFEAREGSSAHRRLADDSGEGFVIPLTARADRVRKLDERGSARHPHTFDAIAGRSPSVFNPAFPSAPNIALYRPCSRWRPDPPMVKPARRRWPGPGVSAPLQPCRSGNAARLGTISDCSSWAPLSVE